MMVSSQHFYYGVIRFCYLICSVLGVCLPWIGHLLQVLLRVLWKHVKDFALNTVAKRSYIWCLFFNLRNESVILSVIQPKLSSYESNVRSCIFIPKWHDLEVFWCWLQEDLMKRQPKNIGKSHSCLCSHHARASFGKCSYIDKFCKLL